MATTGHVQSWGEAQYGSTPRVEECWMDLIHRIQTIPDFKDKIEQVWDEDALLKILKGNKTPFAGVVFNSVQSNSLDASRQGMAADLICTIIIVLEGDLVGGLDEKPLAIRLLEDLRNAIKTTRSPTGHKWRFVLEMPMGKHNGKILFRQNWSTAVILTGP